MKKFQLLLMKRNILLVFTLTWKAFDTIDHQILFEKLEFYAIRGHSLKWIISYLSERKQYTDIYDCKSEFSNIICGVPQGSILGPLLFIIYMNDIFNISSIMEMILFADDTNSFLSYVNLRVLCGILNFKLENYLDGWN